ncbi:MAG: GntR family transcriptional regulator [Butyrivibrio sp.]|nr:GntR family transcriptional regulator [Butyrivibrio sp.]
MPWILNASGPIFVQLIEHLQNNIVSGKYDPGQKLPSVRDLAFDAGVNPNTMQRALSELESTGLVHSETTSGRFITEDKKMIDELRASLADSLKQEFFINMGKLGFSEKEILQFVNQNSTAK